MAAPWKGQYRLRMEVEKLRIFREASEAEWRPVAARMAVSVELQYLPRQEVVWRLETDAQHRKITPSGRTTLDSLYARVTDEIARGLEQYWEGQSAGADSSAQ